MDTEAKKWWFVFCGDRLLLEKGDEGYRVPCAAHPPLPAAEGTRIHELALFDGEPFCTYAVGEPVEESETRTMTGLRDSYYLIPRLLYLMAGKAREILYWDQSNRFCSACGHALQFATSISKRCPACGREVWPSVSTAVIVRIRRGDEILLVHARNFRGDYYGLVAGFVETGETLEECVRRETQEETGLQLQNIRYFGSQPWPYPFGLMVGFTADYAGGTLRLQESELSGGRFFDREHLPRIPGRMSIARRLIDDWLDHPDSPSDAQP